MIRVRTGSRLHFGLLSLPSEHAGPWLNQEGQPTIPRRQFGGVGLMIDRPGIELTVNDARSWLAEGTLAERALQFGKTYCAAVGVKACFAIRVQCAASEHAGLGTGTQLGLAVARAIGELTQQPMRDAITLATQVGRGRRSSLGVHGFDCGGFLIEGGKTSSTAISPRLVRQAFPEDWRILLITPREVVGMHGRREREAFADMVKQAPDDRTTEALCRLVLLGLLPALAERDQCSFGEALYDFNRCSGSMFKAAQGGTYAHPRIEAIVKSLREFGVRGVGQSSWGPTIFALMPAEHWDAFPDWLVNKKIVTADECAIAFPCQLGARIAVEL
ncbi:MAG: beta-RFAP synthase [Planctomycetes bacterium]|nr:beta-RFAP synthase [Planctomycetota bacterium]